METFPSWWGTHCSKVFPLGGHGGCLGYWMGFCAKKQMPRLQARGGLGEYTGCTWSMGQCQVPLCSVQTVQLYVAALCRVLTTNRRR